MGPLSTIEAVSVWEGKIARSRDMSLNYHYSSKHLLFIITLPVLNKGVSFFIIFQSNGNNDDDQGEPLWEGDQV